MVNGMCERFVLKYEAAGDQYLGQCVTGKDHTSRIFVLFPTYLYLPRIDNPEQRLEME